ncbi:yecA family protein [Asticcacaulis biprosthecium C19]|uniref:YecA family protein n=1 Tax=Asticcacaulis biprosthecium C19 TaxID=715226 RepID=F4QP02_9CAUL|nr:UPF0149 family protein [Asticcacaulis biprosthecium]EGF91060.1 yecA family protein [Asticcacaulis biprosthecium C19]
MQDPNELRLDKLEEAMEATGMNLSLFDGFVTAQWVMPDVPTQSWIDTIQELIREAGSKAEITPDLAAQMAEHHKVVGEELRTEVYNPIFWLDDEGDEMWELWAEGFGLAVSGRPEFVEETMANEESEIAMALTMVLALAGVAAGDDQLAEDLSPGDTDALLDDAPEVLMQGLVQLYYARHAPERAISG